MEKLTDQAWLDPSSASPHMERKEEEKEEEERRRRSA